MRPVKSLVLGAIVTLLLFFGLVLKRDRDERRMGAELAMLDVIKSKTGDYAYNTGIIPNSWTSVSNAVDWVYSTNGVQLHRDEHGGNWQFINAFSPPATQLYIPLPHPVPFPNAPTNVVFFVRSKPCSSHGSFGRWALSGSAARIARVWIPERELSPEIRSQIPSVRSNR